MKAFNLAVRFMQFDKTMRSSGLAGLLPQHVRVSTGSAMVLGLLEGKLDASPTTAYLMTYRRGKCSANCGFCPQARESKGRSDMLSRVSWPSFQTDLVVEHLKKAVDEKKVKRVCVQALNYPRVFTHVQSIVKAIRQDTNVPISVSCQPMNSKNMQQLAEAGAERIGIPLDAATMEVYIKVKGLLAGGPYDWVKQLDLLDNAVKVFGRGKVSTHFIVGLGETEEEMANVIQQCVDAGVLPALFAFTPIPGTVLENAAQPSIEKYRRMQLARHLIVRRISETERMRFDREGRLVDWGVAKTTLVGIMRTGEPFLTSGCPDCNRPYYNEKPSGPFYNFPRPLTDGELSMVETELAANG